MEQGVTYKEKYISLLNKINQTIKEKKESISLANAVLNDDNLTNSSIEVRQSLLIAINENEIAINELYKLINSND